MTTQDGNQVVEELEGTEREVETVGFAQAVVPQYDAGGALEREYPRTMSDFAMHLIVESTKYVDGEVYGMIRALPIAEERPDFVRDDCCYLITLDSGLLMTADGARRFAQALVDAADEIDDLTVVRPRPLKIVEDES